MRTEKKNDLDLMSIYSLVIPTVRQEVEFESRPRLSIPKYDVNARLLWDVLL
jgi:hypothetical protein